MILHFFKIPLIVSNTNNFSTIPIGSPLDTVYSHTQYTPIFCGKVGSWAYEEKAVGIF